MEHISEVVSLAAAAMLFGLVAVLVDRRRKHLKLVVRVIDEQDQRLIGFLDRLVQNGQLTPVNA